MIRDVLLSDASAIATIYNRYITHTVITFEIEELTVDAMRERIEAILAKGHPYLVYEEDGRVVAYAYASTYRARPAFDITLEASVYVDSEHTGKGVGEVLYRELISRCRAKGIHSLIGAITLPNEASIRLNEKLGFRRVGCVEEAGKKFGRLIDVAFYQLLLNNK